MIYAIDDFCHSPTRSVRMVSPSIRPDDVNKQRKTTKEVFVCPGSTNLTVIPSGNVYYLCVFVLGIQVKEEEKERGDWEEYMLRVSSPLSHTLLHISKRENTTTGLYKYAPILYKDMYPYIYNPIYP